MSREEEEVSVLEMILDEMTRLQKAETRAAASRLTGIIREIVRADETREWLRVKLARCALAMGILPLGLIFGLVYRACGLTVTLEALTIQAGLLTIQITGMCVFLWCESKA